MNKIQQLQQTLNDAVREVFDQYCKSGKCYDFSLNKEVGADEVCEEYYGNLIDEDEEEVIERIETNCPWAGDMAERWGSSNCYCIGVMSYDGRAYATFCDMGSNEVWGEQIWGFNSDVASMVLDLMH